MTRAGKLLQRIYEAMSREEKIHAAIEAYPPHFWGVPGAAKRGRNPKFPYVPIHDHTHPADKKAKIHQHTRNPIKGFAYATREEAIADAAQQVHRKKEEAFKMMSQDLPIHKSFRMNYGLPRNLADVDRDDYKEVARRERDEWNYARVKTPGGVEANIRKQDLPEYLKQGHTEV